MRNFMLRAAAKLQSHKAREEGQTLIEYALVVAVVSIALAALMIAFGTEIIADAKAEVLAYIS